MASWMDQIHGQSTISMQRAVAEHQQRENAMWNDLGASLMECLNKRTPLYETIRHPARVRLPEGI